MIRSSLLLTAFISLISLTGCNLYGGIDGPSGDEQLLSAARAAFDQGDYATALQDYQQLSANDSDIGLSESAYVGLAQAGASMQAYASAFGKGDVQIGPAITTFAEGILQKGSGQATRVAIWQAFNEQANIVDPNLKALVRFLGSLSFAAEILAETSSNGTQIMKADLSDGKVKVSATPFPSAGTGDLGGSFPASVGAATLADVNVATPTYNMFNAALEEVLQDVQKLSATGTFGTSTLSFANSITTGFTPSGLAIATTAYVTVLTSTQVNIGE